MDVSLPMTVSSTPPQPTPIDRLGPGGGALATECDWLNMQLGALYHCDARGRTTTRLDPEGAPAPRFHLGRTRHGNLWRVRADVPGALVERLSRLAAREALLPAAEASWPAPERQAAIRAALDEADPVREEWAGCVMRLPERPDELRSIGLAARGSEHVDPEEPSVGEALRALRPDGAWTDPLRRPVVVSRQDGRIVSACYAAAGDAHVASEAGVETLPGERRRGHAKRAVAGWLVAVRRAGGVPLYSAHHDNAPSRALATSIGLFAFADTVHWS